jgi:transcriptional regulator with XRE-family HTH domain
MKMTIKELRAAHMMTQAQFAERLGIDRSDLGKYENGKKKITAALIIKVQNAFGVDLDVADSTPVKKPVKKTAAGKTEFYIQSPLGGNITLEEIIAKLPEGADTCYVRVDQNLIWWVKTDGSTGAVGIWE